MSTVTPMTELEAVNDMLEAIWEAPVNSLESPVLDDVATAKRLLDKTSREVQARGWHFNTRVGVAISPDVTTSKIPVPNNALRIDIERSDTRDVTQRGRFLYNITENKFEFTSAVKADIVELLAWDELPEPVKNYIAIRAAIGFQTRMLGDAPGRYTPQDEQDALATMKDADGDSADYNVLNGSYSVASILYR